MDSANTDATPENYMDAFPGLPVATNGSAQTGGSTAAPKNWRPPPSVTSSKVTQVFHIPLEERRFKNLDTPFSSDKTQQANVCKQISRQNGVEIETNLARDHSLTVMVTGTPADVMKAKRDVVNKLQMQANMSIPIPKEHYRFILGPKGKKLTDLELETSTKISIPRANDSEERITISGNKEGIEKAMHEIQLISDQQAKLAFERLNIPMIYHPFIAGPNNASKTALAEKTGARINIPPASVNKDEITVAGEKEGVKRAVEEINKIYNNKRQKCQTVSVEVNKKQHKYVIGPRYQGIHDVLQQYDVSVEVPPLDSDSCTITLRGEPQALGQALSLVYSKANSVVSYEIAAPVWLHRFVIGKQGAHVKKLMSEVPKVHIEFSDGEDKIVLEGPPEEVAIAQKELETKVAELVKTMAYAEVKVNKKYHRNIIGKSGSNRSRMMSETNTNIRIPNEEDPSDLIKIEGDPEGVKRVKAEIMEMAKKMDNEKTRDIMIQQRFHRQLIGQKGESIKEIRDRFNQVQISMPESGAKSDIVTLRGPKEDVDNCYKYLDKYHKELIIKNYQGEVRIFKDFHKNIIGKGGATIKKIREETDTKIDLPNAMSDSDKIIITGKRADVEKAIAMIEKIQKDIANIAEEVVVVPHKLHNAVIGAKGRYIRAIMDECGGVMIRFPAENTTSDNVYIRGPAADVENAKKQLLELVEDRKINSYTAEVKAKPEYHKFLIGRNGVNIRKVREEFGARVVFPTLNDDQPDVITLIGKQESVEKAKERLESMIKELENVVDDTVDVPVKWHKNFVARRGEMLNQIATDFGGVTVSFPRSGSNSEIVRIHGAKDCVAGAKKRILEIVEDLESLVTIECIIEQKHHRHVMGAKGSNVQEITKQYDVQIKFPERPRSDRQQSQEEEKPAENGEAELAAAAGSEDQTNPQDIILITGKKDMAEDASAALKALVPVTKEMDIPFEFHRNIIGKKGKDIRDLMDKYDVNISIPPSNEESNCVKVSGTESKVDRAIDALNKRVEELEAEKQDKIARSFELDVLVDPKYHPKIIGRGGAVIRKMREDYDGVNIQMPAKDSDEPDKIIIQGYEKSANAARDAILKIVSDLEALTTITIEIDARVHNRIIGSRGSAIKKMMETYKVDVRFPRSSDENPNLIEITGDEDDCYDCQDELLNLEEEYLQEINEREALRQFMKPSRDEQKPQKKAPSAGFQIAGAPWENNADNFPSIGGGSAPAASGAWGKR